MAETVRITYFKSSIGYSQRQKDTVRSLGFHRLGQTVDVPDNNAIRGMILHVRHLVRVDEPEATASDAGTGPAQEA